MDSSMDEVRNDDHTDKFKLGDSQGITYKVESVSDVVDEEVILSTQELLKLIFQFHC